LIDFGIIDKLKNRTKRLFEKQKLHPIEMKVKKKDGNPIWIQSYASLITYENKNLIQLVGKDITARRRAEFQLKKSKQQSEELSNELRVIFDNVPALIYYKDTKNNLIRVNQKFAEQLNMRPEDIAGKNAFELFPKEMAEKYWGHDLQIINSGKPEINFIEPMKTPNGVRWTLNSKIPIKDKYGEVVGIIGFGSDITDLKEAEKELRVSERKFRSISEAANDGIYFVNSNGIVTYWNNAAEKIFGYSKEEAIGKSLDALLITEDRKEHFEKNIRLLRETGTSPIMNKTRELAANTKDGEEINIEVSHSTIKIANNWNAIAIVRDITKRKCIEESLRESEQLFRTIAERTDMGILILKNDGLVYMNEQFSEFFGYTKEQMSDWTIDDFPKCVHPDDLQFVVEQARKKQAGHKDIVDNYEFKGIKKSGEIIWLNVYSRTIQYKGDLADLVTLIDITERKKAELELKNSEQRYREAYELANLYKDLLAHDINNILQNIKSAIQLENMTINSSKTSQIKKVKEYHDIIDGQISRGTQLISNIQKLTKLEEVKVKAKKVDLCKVLNESIEFVKNSFGRRKIEINVESFQRNLKLKANEFLSDVFENILINAVKYNNHNHVIIDVKISEETQNNTNYLKIEFMDNGIGIPDENKDIIFNTGTIKGKGGKGMGFGLALVKKIVQNLEGSITVKNRVKNDYTKGSSFIVRLPFKN
jgi:PAS domain S-box-containing protein